MSQDPSSGDEGTPVIRLGKSDVIHTERNTFEIPLVMGDLNDSPTGYATLDANEAARLHAQLTRHLTKGWALTEVEQVGRQSGEIYPVGGSCRLT